MQLYEHQLQKSNSQSQVSEVIKYNVIADLVQERANTVNPNSSKFDNIRAYVYNYDLLNLPQGCDILSFKQASTQHDF